VAGIAFLEHDWARHPWLLQRFGASISLVLIGVIEWSVPVKVLPEWAVLWKDMGMGAPLYCLVIW
jgi:hypothetical protein